MEFITDKLIEKLKNNGVIFEQCNFDEVNLIPNLKQVQFTDKKFDQVIITTSLSNTQRLFKIDMKQKSEHYISQVFIYFTVKEIDFKFQYTQINDLNFYCSRISNCSLYSKVTKENNRVLIAEMPLTDNNKLWNNDDKLRDIAWSEIIKCGIVKDQTKYKTAKVLKVAKTFPVPRVNFFNLLNEIELILKNKFSGNVNMVGQGIFTRHKFIKEILNKLK
jgi:protoporphyrinogen oxidase